MRKKSVGREVLEWGLAFLFAVGFAFLIRQFLFAPILVEGKSMMPTLHDKNRMIVNKVAYDIGEPERFDIVVFHATETKDYIKRVIGLPGEKIEYKNDVLYINDKAYEEPYLDEYKKNLSSKNLTGDFDAVVVPDDCYFLMGDNRLDSRDSRDIGVIPIDKIIGKTNLVFWPMSDFHFVE